MPPRSHLITLPIHNGPAQEGDEEGEEGAASGGEEGFNLT